MKFLLPATIFSALTAAVLAEPLRIPAFTAFGDPDFDAVRRQGRAGSVTGWKGGAQKLLWFGTVKKPGDLEAKIVLGGPAESACDFQLEISPVEPAGSAAVALKASVKAGDSEIAFGKAAVAKAGNHRFALSTANPQSVRIPDISALTLDGPAAEGAHFSTVERRNAASVHLFYPLDDARKEKVAWFYNEVVAREEPVYTFYMACGFHRGYFGMQVNNSRERRVIFSVWDSGNEGVDRSKVAEEDQVKVLAHGDGVVASGFGNEGTGGHSHLVYPWKTGQTYRFLLHAEPQGKNTIYSGYFYFPEKQSWGLIASFRAPKDGSYLKGLHSFNENFGGSNGHLRRLAEFGPQWIRDADGKWSELLTAGFSHDGHGRDMRKDYGMGVKDGRFYLSNGGFVGDDIRYGFKATRPASGQPPPPLAVEGVEKAAKP
jgi:hypothetical protein